MTLVTDALAQKAFDYLSDSPEKAAAARAARHMAEFRTKKKRASLLLQAPSGPVDIKKAWVEAHHDLESYLMAEADAIAEDEKHREYTRKSNAILDCWRTEQANMRTPRV